METDRTIARRWLDEVSDPQSTTFGTVPLDVFEALDSLIVGNEAPLELTRRYKAELRRTGICAR